MIRYFGSTANPCCTDHLQMQWMWILMGAPMSWSCVRQMFGMNSKLDQISVKTFMNLKVKRKILKEFLQFVFLLYQQSSSMPYLLASWLLLLLLLKMRKRSRGFALSFLLFAYSICLGFVRWILHISNIFVADILSFMSLGHFALNGCVVG